MGIWKGRVYVTAKRIQVLQFYQMVQGKKAAISMVGQAIRHLGKRVCFFEIDFWRKSFLVKRGWVVLHYLVIHLPSSTAFGRISHFSLMNGPFAYKYLEI